MNQYSYKFKNLIGYCLILLALIIFVIATLFLNARFFDIPLNEIFSFNNVILTIKIDIFLLIMVLIISWFIRSENS